MIKLAIFAAYCCLFTTKSTSTTTNIKSSLKANCFGSCKWEYISDLQTHTGLDNQFYVASYLHQSNDNNNEYISLPTTYTRVNNKLGQGIVKGKSMAESWANSSANSWQLAPDHPRMNKTNCVRVSQLASQSAIDLYSHLKVDAEYYVLHARHAIIHDTGIIGLECGYYQPLEACETIFKFIGRKWWNKCNTYLKSSKTPWLHFWTMQNSSEYVKAMLACNENKKRDFQHVKRVLLITAQWDHNYHHFLIDCISRVAPMMGFLEQNPDVKIHIRSYEQFAKKEKYIAGGIEMRKRLFHLLGLDYSRVVTGPLLAEEVYMPRAVKCNYPIGHAYQIRLLAKYLIEKSKAITTAAADQSVPIIATTNVGDKMKVVIQQRDCESPGAACLKTWREWNSTVAHGFVDAFAQKFPQLEASLMSSGDKEMTSCLSCQINKYFTQTKVLVGLHGAGLTNMIFMPPGGMVVEITGQFDGRMMPLCGYHGALAAIFGLHHYIYYYDWKGGEVLDAQDIANKAVAFFNEIDSCAE